MPLSPDPPPLHPLVDLCRFTHLDIFSLRLPVHTYLGTHLSRMPVDYHHNTYLTLSLDSTHVFFVVLLWPGFLQRANR